MHSRPVLSVVTGALFEQILLQVRLVLAATECRRTDMMASADSIIRLRLAWKSASTIVTDLQIRLF